ncbi:hypothetical protein BO99DRAFT_100275 [Aspergillus violaceofuscus CBS 115571]|uniref:Uncharacterized protein n=1 Tax=Aspergillus violaceofuscus (strain CBS 115571) TaxID=1450538 RepID=A0A2V5H9F8_ASPV1|nr:hypothetical protein BO99DRAFT_100275 [Aspergillus violaceofuscus CBS 115571]
MVTYMSKTRFASPPNQDPSYFDPGPSRHGYPDPPLLESFFFFFFFFFVRFHLLRNTIRGEWPPIVLSCLPTVGRSAFTRAYPEPRIQMLLQRRTQTQMLTHVGVAVDFICRWP